MTASTFFAGFVQFDVCLGSPAANLRAVEEGLARLSPQAPGIVVLPEMWGSGYDYAHLSEASAHTPELLAALTRLAARYGVLLAGSLPERVDDEMEQRLHNTLFLVDRNGVIGSYRKQELFAPMHEDRYFAAGEKPAPIETPLGLVAALVCYDLRFPELARSQTAAGADLLIVSAQWPAARREHWRTLLRARAIENQIHIIACNRCGTSIDTGFAGHSVIINPDGSIIAEAGEEPAEVWVPIELVKQRIVRERFRTAGRTPWRSHDAAKVLSRTDCIKAIAIARAMGRRVIFTNGCFDVLHIGHVTYLEAARRQGDLLVVGLNSDSSVRAIKGPERPVNQEKDRARLLAALGCVDIITIFDEETPLALITALLPGILVKGADWPVEKIVGAAEVLAAGGQVVNIPIVEDYSTTGFLQRVRKKSG